MIYRIHRCDWQGRTLSIEADSYEGAAILAARRLCRTRSRRLFAQRVTGCPTMSGCYQGYIGLPGGAATSVGPQFQVAQVAQVSP